MRIEKKYLTLVLVNSFFALMILVINFLFLREISNIFSAINIFVAVIFILPFVFWKYLEYRKVKIVESMFPVFLRDFIELMRGGMTIEQSMKNLKKNDYKELNVYVKKMAAQLDWGIPAEKVLINFAKSTNSTLVKRTISSVIESHKFGGNLTDTLEALSNASIEIERLKAERAAYLYSQVTTGYIIFFVFLGVMIAMSRFLIPSLSSITIQATTKPQESLSTEYKSLFMNLICIQGAFAGLSVGKMAEGRIISGVKHSLIMVVIGMLVFVLFS